MTTHNKPAGTINRDARHQSKCPRLSAVIWWKLLDEFWR